MMYYGEMAFLYFNNQDMDSEIPDDLIGDLTEYEKQKNGTLPEGMEYYGSSLLLESNIAIRHTRNGSN